MDQELVILLVMIGAFLLSNFLLHFPVSLGMALSAVLGALVYGIFYSGDISGLGRHLFEGTFTYLDTVLIIAMAMIFMTFIQESGAMGALNNAIVTRFYKKPTIMLILLMIIVMFPGMITGSSTAGVLAAGSIVAPILMLIGVPKDKTGAVIAVGAILGMAAPPVNIPALLIAGGVDMPFSGFDVPLLLITLILGIFTVLFICRKYCRNIDIEELKTHLDSETGKKYGIRVYIPVLVLALVLIIRMIPSILSIFGAKGGFVDWFTQFSSKIAGIAMPLTFLICALLAIIPGCGKKFNVIKSCKEALNTTIPVLGKLMGVGMFIQILTLTGARGWIVSACLKLASIGGTEVTFTIGTILLLLAIAIVCPAFGAVSSYGSATVLGVPFLIVLMDVKFPAASEIIMACALSTIVCCGDLMPPTALSGNYAADLVGVKYSKVLKHVGVPVAVCIVFCLAVLLLAEQLKFLAA